MPSPACAAGPWTSGLPSWSGRLGESGGVDGARQAATLNWKLVESGSVWFAAGESLGQLAPAPHGTFREASAAETPIMVAEPEAGKELLPWLAERRRIAASGTIKTRGLYRKAEDAADRRVPVGVPPSAPFGREYNPAPG